MRKISGSCYFLKFFLNSKKQKSQLRWSLVISFGSLFCHKQPFSDPP